MVPTLTLGNSVQRGVAKIWSLPEVAASELQQALEAAHLATLDDDLAEQVASRIDSTPQATIDEIVATLARLSGIVTGASVPIDDFAADVYETLSKSEDHELNLSEPERARFRGRLVSLLSATSISLSGRARLVFTEHEHYLCYARIMSDVRPIFGNRVDDKPIAATIVHTLKLAYHDAKEVREFFVALDGSSLDRLSDLIERAKRKVASLKATLIDGSGTHYLDT